MQKQLRVIIGETGDRFAASCAAALFQAGDWAILRQQQRELLLRAVRAEHPDALVLSADALNPQLLSFFYEVQRCASIVILAFFRNYQPEWKQQVSLRGVHYLPMPDDACNPAALIHDLCASSEPIFAADCTSRESDVTRLLYQAGISSNLSGFHYLRRAILIYSAGECTGGIMNAVYGRIAAETGSTVGNVERSMRHAILLAWQKADSTSGWQCGLQIRHHMTNSEFIRYASDLLREEQCRSLIG